MQVLLLVITVVLSCGAALASAAAILHLMFRLMDRTEAFGAGTEAVQSVRGGR